MEGGEPAEAKGDLVHGVHLSLARHNLPRASQDVLEYLKPELKLELELEQYLTMGDLEY